MPKFEKLWKNVLQQLENTHDPSIISTWFKNAILEKTSSNSYKIICPNTYAQEIIRKRYQEDLEKILSEITKKNCFLVFLTQKETYSEPNGPLFDQLPERKKEIGESTSITTPPPPSKNSDLNPNYTFDNFVVGSCNRVAHAAALAVTDNPGNFYNPLFIHGGTGVGKTHLMYAIGNALAQKFPKFQICYFPIENFINDFIDALRFKTTDKLKKKYRHNDCLLIDDIQFIGGDKKVIQEEFFHTFNQLYNSGKQIVICSDRPPEEIDRLADRLASRFMGGLLVDIAPPDFETRLAIAKTKAEHLNLSLDNKVLEYIAETTSENVRQIEGLLQKIRSQETFGQTLDLVQVKKITGEKQERNSQKRLTPELILSLVTESFDVSIAQLCGKRRKTEIVIPRQTAMYLLRNELGMNLERIGEILGGRDHSTVIHGIEKVTQLLNNGSVYVKTQVRQIRQGLYG